MRLGCDLSGRSPILLSKAALSLDASSVCVSAAPDAADLLLGELTARRAATLAGLLDRDVKLSADGARAAS
jgi:exopolyphosphatase/guanosine-5'-triphosphate,3'-diphosphate pyrophosphatase